MDDVNSPGWLEILVRMCAGEASEVPFVGILEVAQGGEGDTWPAVVRVFKDRASYRVESLDGRLLTIRRPERTWEFHDDGEPPVRVDNDGGYRHVARGAHGPQIQRRPANEWNGDDFTRPTGPARAVSYLGRAAWEVELAPPEHKPSALRLTVDAATGMVLQTWSVEFGLLHRWTEITDVERHPSALFEWSGEETWYFVETCELSDEDVAEEQREGAAAAARLGVGPLTIAVTPHLQVYDEDEAGGFHVALEMSLYGTVRRRPRSDESWDLDQHFEHELQWSDGPWDWCVACDEAPDQLAEIRRQLSEPRPEHT